MKVSIFYVNWLFLNLFLHKITVLLHLLTFVYVVLFKVLSACFKTHFTLLNIFYILVLSPVIEN